MAGSVTNVAFLAALAGDEDFAAGRVETGLIERKQAALTVTTPPSREVMAWALALSSGFGDQAVSADPWITLTGYSHFQPLARRACVEHAGQTITAEIVQTSPSRISVQAADGAALTLTLDDPPRIARWPGHITIFADGHAHDFVAADPLLRVAASGSAASSMRAPMPGIVKLVRVAAGDAVRKGQALLVLEAMKMEHAIQAARDGVIAEIASEGAQVKEGTALVRFVEPGPSSA